MGNMYSRTTKGTAMRVNDLNALACEAAHRTFDLLAEDGLEPSLSAEDGSLVLRTEEGSAELLIVLGTRSTPLGVECARLVAASGIGEGSESIAAVMADTVVELVKAQVSEEIEED
nr:MAG TPA: hypothetical protein [Caudoviricetes sp.]